MNISRRQMLQLSAGAAAASIWGTRRAPTAVAAPAKKIPIGLELWSVRQLCEKELPMVLKAVGQMGYDAVELAHSYYGYDAAAWRKLLDENGLKSCGMHMGLPALQGDAFQKTVEMHRRWLSNFWDQYSPQAHLGLAQMYVDDERFTSYYDAHQPGTAVFLRDAVQIYVTDK